MPQRTTPLLLIGLGTIALYVAYTGRLAGIWSGLTGKLDKPPTATPATPATPAGQTGTDYSQWGPGTPTPTPNPSHAGEGGPSGYYTVTPTGNLVITHSGR